MTGGITVEAVYAFISPDLGPLRPCGSGGDLAIRQPGRHAEDSAVVGAPVSPDLRRVAGFSTPKRKPRTSQVG